MDCSSFIVNETHGVNPFANDSDWAGFDQIETTKHVIQGIVIPLVCGVGIIGNMANLCVFGSRCYMHKTNSLEQSAIAGLMALAISDLCFCMDAFPGAFLHQGVSSSDSTVATMSLYYNTYSVPVHNLFLFCSTWCIVVISLERYMAVCHPFQARWFIRLWKTVVVHLVVLLVSVLVTVPEFLKWEFSEHPCNPGCVCIGPSIRDHYNSPYFRTAYMIVWAVIGTFLPLVILSFCNIRLLREIYRSRNQGMTDPERYCSSRITITVVGIITMFLFLVCPSMILELVKTPLLHALDYEHVLQMRMASLVLNLLQAVKFSCNFWLYCAVNKQFRESMTRSLHNRRSGSRTSTDTANKYSMTTLKMS